MIQVPVPRQQPRAVPANDLAVTPEIPGTGKAEIYPRTDERWIEKPEILDKAQSHKLAKRNGRQK